MTTSSGPEDEEIAGVLRWYDPNRGYGFVTTDLKAPGNRDIFLHGRHLNPTQRQSRPPVGARITYKVRISHKTEKPEAYDAKLES